MAIRRGRRELEVLPEPAVAPEQLVPTQAAVFQAAVRAAGQRVPIGDEKALVRFKRKERWQRDAWECYDAVPEVKFTVLYIGNLLSRVRLFPAWQESDREPPISVDDERSGLTDAEVQIAQEALAQLSNSEAGVPGIMRELAQNWSVPGECHLVGMRPRVVQPDKTVTIDDAAPLVWDVKSIDELVFYEGALYVIEYPEQPPTNGVKLVEDDDGGGDYVARLWQRHPRFSAKADSSLMAVLDVCEELQLINQEARARSRSRMSAGILTVPTELSFGAPDPTTEAGDGDTAVDPFDEDLQRVLITPISDEGHPSAVAPAVLRGPKELLGPDAVRWITFHRNEDGGLDDRRERLAKRLARGLPLPLETILGHQETTFANAAQVSIDEYRAHVEPLVLMLVLGITTGFYRPHLEAAGLSPEKVKRLVVWYDPSAIVTPPDHTDAALKTHEALVISDDALRRAANFSAADAPTFEELVRRTVLEHIKLDPALTQVYLERFLGAESADAGAQDGTDVGTDDDDDDDAAAAAAAAVMRREFAIRLEVYCETEMRHALARAGARLRNRAASELKRSLNGVSQELIAHTLGRAQVHALGFTDQQLIENAFVSVGDRFDRLIPATVPDAWRDEAKARLLQLLNDYALVRLYSDDDSGDAYQIAEIVRRTFECLDPARRAAGAQKRDTLVVANGKEPRA